MHLKVTVPEVVTSLGLSWSLRDLKETLPEDKLETALCHRKKSLSLGEMF